MRPFFLFNNKTFIIQHQKDENIKNSSADEFVSLRAFLVCPKRSGNLYYL